MNLKRISGGRQAKHRGANFENVIHTEAMRLGWTVVKIPMGARMISNIKMIRVQTPFDFVFVKKERVIFADAKTIKGNSFTHGMLTDHQVEMLYFLQKHGHFAGYIVNFTTHKKTVFFKASQLYFLRPGTSLKPHEGILLGENYIINLSRLYPDTVSIPTTT